MFTTYETASRIKNTDFDKIKGFLMKIKTINPATEEIIENYDLLSEETVDLLINKGHVAFESWKRKDFSFRGLRMLQLAKLLREKQKIYAELIASEMGKPISAAIAEIEKCAWVCEHFAKEAKSYLAPKLIQTESKKNVVCYKPLGLVFAIMPWNFPFWQVFRFAAPTIMAGNAAILKHAPISTGSGVAIAELFLEAGFPEHVFQHFIISNEMAATVIANKKVTAVTLTGSEQAGSIVAAEAGKHLKKVVLELGGNDPYLVLFDADLDLAAQCIVSARMNNSGQVCIAPKRIIVVESRHEQLLDKILALASQYVMGDPLNPNTTFGPMARSDLRQNVHRQVLASVAKGARLLVGGEIPNRCGYYYPPTVLTHVEPGMPAFDDEVFGPVISVIKAKDERHAIQLANQSRFGLGAAVFTRDLARGEQIATNEIEAGACFVNAMVISDPRLPFGGIKHSGFGRELSREGILEFTNVKTVSISEINSK